MSNQLRSESTGNRWPSFVYVVIGVGLIVGGILLLRIVYDHSSPIKSNFWILAWFVNGAMMALASVLLLSARLLARFGESFCNLA